MIETQKTIENKKYQKAEISGLNHDKEEILRSYRNFDVFSSIMKSDLISDIDKKIVISILNTTSDEKLCEYFYEKLEGSNLIDENSIKDFIDYFKPYIKEKNTKEIFENSYSHIRNKISKIKEILKDNKDFLSLVSKLEELDKRNDKLSEDFQKEHQNLIKELANYLSKDNNATKIFQKLQDDPESYEALYKFLQNLENPQVINILQNIPPNPKGLQLGTRRAQVILDTNPYFPHTDPKNITKTGNILHAKIDDTIGKIVDIRDIPPRTYITGPNGYRIETKTISPEILALRATFTKEKLRIQNQIEKNSRQILQYNEILQGKDINTLIKEKEKLEKKENTSLQDEIRLFELEDQIKAFSQAQDKLQKLQRQNEDLEKELIQKEEEFLKYYSKSVGKENKNIEKNDTEAKNTLEFLQNIGFTHIPYNDFLKIQAIINVSPSYYGFSKPLDLNQGFSYEKNSEKNNKEEFINFFNKILPEKNQISIEMEKRGNLGDKFKKENFKMKLMGDNNLLNSFGQLNMDYFRNRFKQK